MTSLAGWKGERIHCSRVLERTLQNFKEEIIDFAVDQCDEYSIDWLASQIVEIWWENLPRDIEPSQIEKIIRSWDSEIQERIKESFEPLPREEALKEIQQEALKGAL